MTMNSVSVGIKIGMATSGTMMASSQLDGGNISITAAVTCCVFVAGVVWWLAKKFEHIDGQIKELKDQGNDLKEQVKRLTDYNEDQ